MLKYPNILTCVDELGFTNLSQGPSNILFMSSTDILHLTESADFLTHFGMTCLKLCQNTCCEKGITITDIGVNPIFALQLLEDFERDVIILSNNDSK